MKKWGYYLALIIGILNVLAGLFASILNIFVFVPQYSVTVLPLLGMGITPLVFGIVIIAYLRKVKYEFEGII